MGSIYSKTASDGKPRYHIRFKTTDGKWRSEAGGRYKKNAQSLLDRREREIANGEYGRGDISFSDFADVWLEAVKLDVKASTYDTYEVLNRVHIRPYFDKMMLSDITPAKIQQFRALKSKPNKKGKKLAPGSVNKILRVLHSMFEWGVVNGYLDVNPMKGIKKVREDNDEMDFLRPEEARKFLDACSPRFFPIAATALFTGMRQGELGGLRWGDVDLSKGLIYVRRQYHPRYGFTATKSERSNRAIVMTPELVAILTVHKSKSGGDSLVFTNEVGKANDPYNLTRREYYPALERAGLRRVVFHALRHSYASLMISLGANLKFLQHQLGHSSLTVTLDRYAHLISDVAENGVCERFDSLVYPDKDRDRWPREGLHIVK